MSTKELLSKPNWNYKEVMEYCDCKKSKAYEIMKVCKEKFGGSVRFNTKVVSRDSVLAYCGTTIERERYVINQLDKGNDN